MVQLNMTCTVTIELLVIIITCHIFHSQEKVQMSSEKRLIKELTLNYSERGKMGRPVVHHNEIVTVDYALSLMQILDLDEKNQVFKTSLWIYHLYYGTAGLLLTNFIDSPEGNIKESTAKRNKIFYPCCVEPYYDITFIIVMQRRIAFQSYILIMPCILLSSLTLVLFWLPPESPVKLQLEVDLSKRQRCAPVLCDMYCINGWALDKHECEICKCKEV